MDAHGPWGENPQVGVGVSGGPDSLALTLLAYEWVKTQNGRLHALTVDHNLRRESSQEAFDVHTFLKNQGIDHTVLTWHPPADLVTRVQERARTARYDLLLKECQKEGLKTLLLGHHLDDQKETQLFRLMRGSTLMGMAGMSGRRQVGEVTLVRPLLSIPKQDLEDFLRSQEIAWAQDPSNHNTKYMRTQMRAVLGNHSFEILEQSGRLQRVRRSTENVLNHLLGEIGTLGEEGVATLDLVRFLKLPKTWQKMILARVLMSVSPTPYPIRQARLDALTHALGTFRARTCGGCLLTVRKNILRIEREKRIRALENAPDSWTKFFWVYDGLSEK